MPVRCPWFASDLSGIPELVQPGFTGWLVPPANPQALADTLEEVYHNPHLAKQLAGNGHSLVLKEFDLETSSHKLANLFETSLIKKIDRMPRPAHDPFARH